MNHNSLDGDLHIQRNKALARAAANDYALAQATRPARPNLYRRGLVAAGGLLIALGHRLQGELEAIDIMPTTAEWGIRN